MMDCFGKAGGYVGGVPSSRYNELGSFFLGVVGCLVLRLTRGIESLSGVCWERRGVLKSD